MLHWVLDALHTERRVGEGHRCHGSALYMEGVAQIQGLFEVITTICTPDLGYRFGPDGLSQSLGSAKIRAAANTPTLLIPIAAQSPTSRTG